jgi:prepilin-type N-terminal cleavage/methylation domain-containing protein
LSPGGFTLVELMITVAIVGILMMVAIPNFLRMREKAKISEAKANLGAIRVTEHAFYSEYNHYVGNQAETPDRSANPAGRHSWDRNTRFSILGFAPDGTVFFSYGLQGADFPTDSFTARAVSDLDGNGAWSTWHLTGGDKEMYHEGADL